MTRTTHSTLSLFQQVLGASFDRLPQPVQRIHAHQGLRRYHGHIEIERSSGLLSRLFGWAARLPPAGRGGLVVEVLADRGNEHWTRRIGRHTMRSQLWGAHGLLYERLGLVTFGFRLDADGTALTWTVARVSVLGIVLPASAFRAVQAQESERCGQYNFNVVAALPGIGPLIRYRGRLNVA